MDLNRFTEKAQEAVAQAQSLAAEYSHGQIEGEHLLLALLRQSDGVVPQIVQRLGLQPDSLIQQLGGELDRRPRVYGGAAQVSLSRELQQTLQQAVKIAEGMHDDFVSTEHLLLALSEDRAGSVGRLLQGHGLTKDNILRVLAGIRGSQRVTSQTPGEHLSGAGKVWARPDRAGQAGQARPGHRPRRRDPARDPGPQPPHQEQPGADRRPGRGQDGHRRGPGPADRARRRAGRAERQAAGAARPGGHDRRGQVPRRVRGAAQGRAERDHRRRGADHPLYRRAAHGRRRRRRRGSHGRQQHAQADAGPRRAARRRCYHPGRIPPVHRKRSGPGASLPAGPGRRAERGGDDQHPARA